MPTHILFYLIVTILAWVFCVCLVVVITRGMIGMIASSDLPVEEAAAKAVRIGIIRRRAYKVLCALWLLAYIIIFFTY